MPNQITPQAGSNTSADGQQLNPLAVNLAKAIRLQEGGGKVDYNAVGDGGTSTGAYQFHGDNFKNWATQYGLNPSDFSPVNQDKVAYARINDLLHQGRAPSEVAAMWNGAHDVNGKMQAINPSYVEGVKNYYGQIVGGYGGTTPSQGATTGYGGVPLQTSRPDTQNQPTQPTRQPQQPQSQDANLTGIPAVDYLGNRAADLANFLFPVLGDIKNGGQGKTGLQIAGDTALSALPFVPGLGEVGTGVKGAEAVGEGARAAGLLPKLLKGAALGYGYGSAQNLSQGQGVGQSVTPQLSNLTGAGLGAAGGVTLDALSKIGGSAEGDLQKSIQAAMPYQSKGTRMEQLLNTYPESTAGKGGVVRQGILKTSAAVPSSEDVARGTAANEFIKGVNDPVMQIPAINQGIKTTSNAADSFMNQKAANANFSDMIDYLETNRPTQNLQKDPGAADAYQRATQDIIQTVYDTMKKTAETTGDYGPITSGADVRAARIAIDQQINRELGEATLGSPQYRGIKAAASDGRNLLNRLQEDMLRYPGQLNKLNQMNKFVGDAAERPMSIDMQNPEIRGSLEKSFGLSPTGEEDATQLAAMHKKMSLLYDTRQNIAEKYQSKIGSNKVNETIASKPALAFASNLVKRALPFGVGSHL